MERFYHRPLRIVRGAVLSATMIGMVVTLGIAVIPNARAGDDEHGCTLATLNAAYGFTSTGTVNGVGLVANVGVNIFDGRGNLSHQGTNVRNGVVRPFNNTGTYIVNANCTGSWALSSGVSADFVILAKSSEVMFIRTEGGSTVTGILRKQFPDHENGRGD